jgi:hypothetical protein
LCRRCRRHRDRLGPGIAIHHQRRGQKDEADRSKDHTETSHAWNRISASSRPESFGLADADTEVAHRVPEIGEAALQIGANVGQTRLQVFAQDRDVIEIVGQMSEEVEGAVETQLESLYSFVNVAIVVDWHEGLHRPTERGGCQRQINRISFVLAWSVRELRSRCVQRHALTPQKSRSHFPDP